MRFAAPVLIVLIICVFVLLIVWLNRRQVTRAAELHEAKRQARVATSGLKQIQSDIGAQVTAGYTDLTALARHVQDTLDGMEPDRKELAR